MVKRISTTILAILYLAITSGVLINVHYCMGEVAAVEYGHPTTSTCGECGMEEKEGCCSTETAFVKVSEQHKAESTLTFKSPPPVFAHSDYRVYPIEQHLQPLNISRQTHSPPYPVIPSLNILYGNFRI
jgi:hypothetical protein